MKSPKYMCSLKTIVIVHGKSELVFCRHIKSNLRLMQEIVSHNKGESSIQVTSLMKLLNKKPFNNFKSFIQTYGVLLDDNHYDKKRCSISPEIHLYPIMDLDDCTSEQLEAYKNKKMFESHWLYNNIHPIYSQPNLEAALTSIKIKVENKKDYIKIFPINRTNDLDLDSAQKICAKLKNCPHTNLAIYLEHCIHLAQEALVK